MSTDQELLELAARAAGIEADWNNPDTADYEAQHEGMWLMGYRSPDNSEFWNPLRNDGDALRLAATLKIEIRIPDGIERRTVFWAWDRPTNECIELPNESQDEAAATRRAIVRAASMIGLAMP